MKWGERKQKILKMLHYVCKEGILSVVPARISLPSPRPSLNDLSLGVPVGTLAGFFPLAPSSTIFVRKKKKCLPKVN